MHLRGGGGHLHTKIASRGFQQYLLLQINRTFGMDVFSVADPKGVPEMHPSLGMYSFNSDAVFRRNLA